MSDEVADQVAQVRRRLPSPFTEDAFVDVTTGRPIEDVDADWQDGEEITLAREGETVEEMLDRHYDRRGPVEEPPDTSWVATTLVGDDNEWPQGPHQGLRNAAKTLTYVVCLACFLTLAVALTIATVRAVL